MLQLPYTPPKFTKGQIAEIMRGGSGVKVRSKPDPVMALIKKADAVLDEYYAVVNEAWGARWKIEDKHDHAEGPSVYIPDELLNVEWSRGHAFQSIAQINKQFSVAQCQAQQRIDDAQKSLKRPHHPQIVRELHAGIESARRALKLLRKHRTTVLNAFRAERDRLQKVQSKVGLIDARAEVRRVYKMLQAVTKELSNTKPQTLQGAVKAMQYVEARLWCDRPGLFHDDGDCPGKFGPMMRSALAILSEHLPE